MTIETEGHAEGLGVGDFLHLVDLTVTFEATDTAVDVDRMVEIDVVRQLVDLEFWFHLLEQGDFIYTSEPLCCFRRHAGQQSEVNGAGGIGKWEIFQLFGDYRARACDKGQPVRLRRFNHLYYELRKKCRRSAYVPAEMLEMKSELSGRISRLWYAAYWSRRKITRPVTHLFQWLERRLRRGHAPLTRLGARIPATA